MEIGLRVDPEADREALDELADAMLVWADDAESERLTDVAVAAVWSGELAALIRDGLARVAELGGEWRSAATIALADVEQLSSGAEVVRAVVQHLAMQLSQQDHPPFFCVCCVDEIVATAPRSKRRELARRVAVVTRRNAAIPETELRAVLATAISEPPVRRLASLARRRAVRARLGRVGRLARKSMPELAAELEAIGAEPLPEQPEEDDIWCEVCDLLLSNLVRPELN